MVNGSAKAWVNFNGTGTIASRDSLNVSGLTDNGTGDYTINFSNAFSAADYAFFGMGASGSTSTVLAVSYSPAPTTSAIKIISRRVDNNGLLDEAYNTLSTMGELA